MNAVEAQMLRAQAERAREASASDTGAKSDAAFQLRGAQHNQSKTERQMLKGRKQ